MAENVCRILLKQEKLKEMQGQINLRELPVGDLFRTTSLTTEDYELFGKLILGFFIQNIYRDEKYFLQQ